MGRFAPLTVLATAILMAIIDGSPANGQATERIYSGFVGKELAEYDGIVNVNAEVRMLWANRSADVIFCARDSEKALRILAKGNLDNSEEGKLTGSLTQLDGHPLGTITMRKRISQQRTGDKQVIWEGDLGQNSEYKVRIKFSESADKHSEETVNYPQMVTKKFINKTPYIPQGMYIAAYPRFEKFEAALNQLDKTFPKWRDIDDGDCSSELKGHFDIDYETTDILQIGSIIRDLRKTDYFRFVELGVPEYGGLPEQVTFSGKKHSYKTLSEMLSRFDKVAAIAARDVFCAKKCIPVPMSAKASNIRLFEITGKSEDLHFKKVGHWENYIVAMTAISHFTYDGAPDGFTVQFSIQSGFNAPSGNGERPSSARFKENPIDDAELSTLSSKLQKAIAKLADGEYSEEM